MGEILVRPMRVEDFKDVMEIYVSCDEDFPFTLLRGEPPYPDALRWSFIEYDPLMKLVAEVDGKVVGYLSINRHWEDPDAGYLEFLIVHRNFRRRGVATALIREAHRIFKERGFRRYSLDTWLTNFRARNLYRKMGFVWVPESEIVYENFLLTIEKVPICAEWLNKHPDAKLSVTEHPVESENGKFWVYEWKSDGDELRVEIDVKSKGIRSITSTEGKAILHVSAVPVKWKYYTGENVSIRVRALLEGNGELALGIHVKLPEGWKANPSFISTHIRPSEQYEVNISLSPEGDELEEGVKSFPVIVSLGGRSVELMPSFKVEAPLEIIAPDSYVIINSGERAEVPIAAKVKRNLEHATIKILCEPDLLISPREIRIERAKEGDVVKEKIALMPAGDDYREYRVKFVCYADKEGKAVRLLELPVVVTRFPGVAVLRTGDQLIIDNPHMRVILNAKTGDLKKIVDKTNGVKCTFWGGIREGVHPNFNLLEFVTREFRIVEKSRERCVIEAIMESFRNRDLRLTRRITVTNSMPALLLEWQLTNTGERPFEGALKVALNVLPGDESPAHRLVVPYRNSVISDRVVKRFWPPIFPLAIKIGESEGWIAIEDELQKSVTGIVVRENTGVDEIVADYRGYVYGLGFLQSKIGKLNPGESINIGPVALLITRGDWSIIRHFYLNFGGKKRLKSPIKILKPYVFSIEAPNDVIRKDKPSEIVVTARRLVSRPAAGTIRLRESNGIRFSPNCVRFEVFEKDCTSERLSVTIDENLQPGIYEINGEVEILGRILPLSRLIALVSSSGTLSYKKKWLDDKEIVLLENDEIEVSIFPELGGRLYGLLLKSSGNQQFLQRYGEVPPPPYPSEAHEIYGGCDDILITGWEWPGEFTCSPFEYEIIKGDGKISVSVWREGSKKLKGMMFRKIFTLYPGVNFVKTEYVIENMLNFPKIVFLKPRYHLRPGGEVDGSCMLVARSTDGTVKLKWMGKAWASLPLILDGNKICAVNNSRGERVTIWITNCAFKKCYLGTWEHALTLELESESIELDGESKWKATLFVSVHKDEVGERISIKR